MNEEKLFNYYYNLMSNEMREEITGYKHFKMKNVKCAIRVNFKNGDWIRVYQKNSGSIEWY